MADGVHQETDNILGEGANLVHTQNIITVPVSGVQNGQDVGDDILQQAFQEASGPFEAEQVSYEHGQVPSVANLADASTITLSEGAVISGVGDGDIIYTLDSAGVVNSVQNGVQEIHALGSHEINGDGDASFLQQVVGQINQHAISDQVGDGNQIVVQLHDASSQNCATTSLSTLDTTDTQLTVAQNAINPLTQAADSETLMENNSVSVQGANDPTVSVPEVSRTEPLGSSQNPIRIVQQGNQYTSLQQLTAEQLSQIMQVVQQQQLMKTAQPTGVDSSVLFNPQTQTRIVYKVLYPSELHKRSGSGTNSNSPGSVKPARTQICVPTDSIYVEVPKRAYRKRIRPEDDDKASAPELSKEEKDDRKKHRPRTRSGRVSRPPKHMVKDYKHIHPVDWDEDYDDSDGGYSDFHPSSGGEEGEALGGPKRKKDGSYRPYSLIGQGKDKPWKCKVCDKAYIGKAGLARHYRLSPEHGQDDENFKDCGIFNGMDSGNSMDSMPGSHTEQNFAEDDNPEGHDYPEGPDYLEGPASPAASPAARMEVAVNNVTTTAEQTTAPQTTTSVTSPPVLSQPPVKTVTTVLPGAVAVKSNGCPPIPQKPVLSKLISAKQPLKTLLKSRQTHNQENVPAKKKAKLKEFIRDFDDEDLMEIVLPRLCKSVSTWEFLLMKVERGRPMRPQLVDLLQEYAQLYRRIRKMTDNQLHPLAADQDPKKLVPGSTQIQISDELVAHSLSLSTGMYTVNPTRTDDTFRYKLLTTSPPECAHHPSKKRTVEAVQAQDLIAPSPKRVRVLLSGDSTRASPVKKPPELVAQPGPKTVLKPILTSLLPWPKPPDVKVQVQDSTPEKTTQEYTPLKLNAEDIHQQDQPQKPPHLMQTVPNVSMEYKVEENTDTLSGLSDTQHSEQQQQQHNEESHTPGSNVTTDNEPNSHDDLATENVTIVMKTIDPSLHNGCELPGTTTYPVVMDSQGEQEGSVLAESNTDSELMHDVKPSLPTSSASSIPAAPIFTMQDLPDEIAQQTVNTGQAEPVILKLEQQTPQSAEEHMTTPPPSLDVQLQSNTSSMDSALEQVPASMAGDLEAGPHPGVETNVALSVEGAPYGGQLTDNIVQQFVTDSGLILEDNTTQVLVQEEAFLAQNGLAEADSNSQGEFQDPNADDRLILIKNPDGTIQIHRQGNQPISLETLQALLGMELDIPMATAETTNSL